MAEEKELKFFTIPALKVPLFQRKKQESLHFVKESDIFRLAEL